MNANKAAGQPAESDFIGSAFMDSRGVITLYLRGESPDGTIGDARIEYYPDDHDYADIVRHLDGIRPGETRPVRPFPEKQK